MYSEGVVILSRSLEHLQGTTPIIFEELLQFVLKMCGRDDFHSSEHIGEVSSNFFDVLRELV